MCCYKIDNQQAGICEGWGIVFRLPGYIRLNLYIKVDVTVPIHTTSSPTYTTNPMLQAGVDSIRIIFDTILSLLGVQFFFDFVELSGFANQRF